MDTTAGMKHTGVHALPVGMTPKSLTLTLLIMTLWIKRVEFSTDRNGHQLRKHKYTDRQICKLNDLFEKYVLTKNQQGYI